MTKPTINTFKISNLPETKISALRRSVQAHEKHGTVSQALLKIINLYKSTNKKLNNDDNEALDMLKKQLDLHLSVKDMKALHKTLCPKDSNSKPECEKVLFRVIQTFKKHNKNLNEERIVMLIKEQMKRRKFDTAVKKEELPSQEDYLNIEEFGEETSFDNTSVTNLDDELHDMPAIEAGAPEEDDLVF